MFKEVTKRYLSGYQTAEYKIDRKKTEYSLKIITPSKRITSGEIKLNSRLNTLYPSTRLQIDTKKLETPTEPESLMIFSRSFLSANSQGHSERKKIITNKLLEAKKKKKIYERSHHVVFQELARLEAEYIKSLENMDKIDLSSAELRSITAGFSISGKEKIHKALQLYTSRFHEKRIRMIHHQIADIELLLYKIDHGRFYHESLEHLLEREINLIDKQIEKAEMLEKNDFVHSFDMLQYRNSISMPKLSLKRVV